ncbi:MAG: adenylosuccinate synthase, partial [Candidatus Cloacimonetes bacterium]|nr:adenylosuccinate synthase [Candidatus Cloacimonadota bacterium]
MSVTAIVGAQWGDEGKGRIVDYLAQNSDVVIRFQGGDNAGHTIINDKGKFALHIIPSGVFNKNTTCLIGAGTVVNFETLESELASIAHADVDGKNIFVDRRAHLIMPYHCLLDGAEEASKKKGWEVGTTKKGIGPCYSDKAARVGLRAGDILDRERFKTRLEMLMDQKNRQLEFYNLPLIDLEEMMSLRDKWFNLFGDKVVDTLPIIKKAIKSDKSILLEGQLGIMRDLDWGIYPYTTSSNPSAGGAVSGSGISPNKIDEIVGVLKVYSTSVGGGPFPTELFDETGKKLQTIGREIGATTGRARRCGWLDIVAANYSTWINGFTSLALTKLDVLDTFETIKICTSYKIGDQVVTELPDTATQEIVQPIYEEFEGWMSDTTGARKWDDLPVKAQQFVNKI